MGAQEHDIGMPRGCGPKSVEEGQGSRCIAGDYGLTNLWGAIERILRYGGASGSNGNGEQFQLHGEPWRVFFKNLSPTGAVT